VTITWPVVGAFLLGFGLGGVLCWLILVLGFLRNFKDFWPK
jgi:hypothetical protein